MKRQSEDTGDVKRLLVFRKMHENVKNADITALPPHFCISSNTK
jgi:hypothetical protein